MFEVWSKKIEFAFDENLWGEDDASEWRTGCSKALKKSSKGKKLYQRSKGSSLTPFYFVWLLDREFHWQFKDASDIHWPCHHLTKKKKSSQKYHGKAF